MHRPPAPHRHVGLVPEDRVQEPCHVLRRVGTVPVHQDVIVGVHLLEHGPHHVALAPFFLADDHGPGGPGGRGGAVAAVVVENVDRGLRQGGAEFGNDVPDGRLLVTAGHQHRYFVTLAFQGSAPFAWTYHPSGPPPVR